jgi:PAS domain S-box-containing protein
MTSNLPRTPALPQISQPPSDAVAWSVCAAAVVLMAVVRIGWLHDTFLPIAYGIPLVLNLWLGNRATLWAMTAAFLLIAAVKNLVILPTSQLDTLHRLEVFAFVVLDTGVISLVVDRFILARRAADRRNAELLAANEDLANREEEIARQNEELQSQAEELERQSEELRVSNDELARRERTLQGLLSLSRALSADLTRQETLERVCDALGELIDDPDAGIAILEQAGGELVVRCGRGLAAGGPRPSFSSSSSPPASPSPSHVPAERSFASLVLTHGRTGYIEDITLRPDLQLPAALNGAPFKSVLATPLRVAGRATGTIEIFGRRKQAFSDEQVALIESVAAQASVSLETAELFERVAAERNRFQAVFRFLPIGATVVGVDGRDARTNPAGAAILGLSTDDDALGKPKDDGWVMYHNGQRLEPPQWPMFRALSEGRETPPVEYDVVTTPSGRRLTLLIGAAPFKDARGRVIGAVSAFADVSTLKQLQRELDARRREAEEASVRKTRFLAAISHDIRTPANAMSLLAELIRRAASNPAMADELPGLAQELHGSATSLVNLLGEVLDVARFDSGRIDLQETEFTLAELLAEEQRRLQPLAREKGLDLRVSIPNDDGMRLRGDRIKLGRVIDNLVGNAIKFTPAGHVRVEAERTDDRTTRIRVTDTGIGIGADDQRHIFDEFFQLSNPERDRSKGTGLGLSICKRLTDAMGGELLVESEAGAGSTFTIVLPPSACA